VALHHPGRLRVKKRRKQLAEHFANPVAEALWGMLMEPREPADYDHVEYKEPVEHYVVRVGSEEAVRVDG
jgi:hypothetical protein